MKLLCIALVVQLCAQICLCDTSSSISTSQEDSSKEQSNHLDIEEKIYGGQQVWDRNQFAYVAKLESHFQNEGSSYCSGVVLSDKVILTLANCVVKIGGVRAERVVARLPRGGIYTFITAEITVNPNYNYLYSNNYAILRKNTNRTFMRNYGTPPVLPANLVNGQYVEFDQTLATVVGWGRTSDSDRFNNMIFSRLHSGNVVILATNVLPNACGTAYPELEATLTAGERILCTQNNIAGICQGDWGGPLLVGNILVGLSMFRTGGCTNLDDTPSAYADVQYIADWIRPQITN